MGFLMFLADLAGLFMAGFVTYCLFNLFKGIFNGNGVEEYLVYLLLCMILFMYSRLYPGSGVNPADEIKLVVERNTIAVVIGFVILYFIKPTWEPNLWATFILLGVAPTAVLFARWSIRILARRMELWGEPAVVIGHQDRIAKLVEYFARRQRLGFVPILAAVPSLPTGEHKMPVPVITIEELLKNGKNDLSIALVEIERIPGILQLDTEHVFAGLFSQVLLVFDVDWLEGASLRIQDFEGLLGVQVQKNVLSPLSKLVKRTVDILLSILLGVFSLPFLIAGSLAVYLDRPGPIFYIQERIGKKGDNIRLYKFRTMVVDADQVLIDHLRENPAAQLEWDQTQKLQNDPRITRSGKWLRKFSIDELPQLINVLKGEMSLVGPRPMLAGQAAFYQNINMYYEVSPGITGLWQVSGRNNTTFDERARYDIYYVRNWSVWLDIYILLRTVWVVLSHDGAY